MELYSRSSNKNEIGEDIGNALLLLIEKNLDIENWGFRLTFKNFSRTSNVILIYDSEWCRVSFMFSRMRIPDMDELSIEYGRLHAPNEEPFMVWNGDECRCWHNVLLPLRFLDGMTPTEAYKQVIVNKQLPLVVKEFTESKYGKNLMDEYPPKYNIVLQNTLWNHYKKRLFEFFDLRQPDLWNKYRDFLSVYYRLIGMKSDYGPPYENVC